MRHSQRPYLFVFFYGSPLTPLYKPVKPSLLTTWLTICIMFLREPSWGCVCNLTFTLSATILFAHCFDRPTGIP